MGAMGAMGPARRMRRSRTPVAVCAAAALAALTCRAASVGAEARPPYGGSVEGSLLGAPVALDPVEAQSHAEITVVGLVFDTLYAIGADGTAQPHLALGPPVLDAPRTTAHIALRRGVAFHDQATMTASDVADSLERARTRLPWLLAPVAAVRTAGDGIDLVLRAPDVDVAPLLALPQTAITRRGQAPAAARPVGSGPFLVDSFDPAARHLTLRAFDDHFAGRPYLDRIGLSWFDAPDAEVRRFETGAAQLSARGQTAFPGARPKFPAQAIESPAAVLVFVGFGRRHATAAVVNEPAFRRALDLALDRGALATITAGERTLPTQLPLPPEAGAPRAPLASAGDPARALEVLRASRAAALAPAALARLRLSILVDETRPDDKEIALRVARGLDRLGIGYAIEAVGAAVLRDRVQNRDCDLWIGQLAAPLGVAAAWWGAAFAAGNDDWPRRPLMQGGVDPVAASAEFARKLPIVPLMFRSLLMWVQKDVHGLAFDASARPGLADLYWFKARP